MWRACVATYRTGLYPALALCIRRRGQVVLDRSLGHVRGNAPHDPADAHRVVATPRTLFNLFSASKMVTAMLVHLCDQRGLLHLDDPVAHYLPAFGQHGKDRITLRHVLTHRAGIPNIPRAVRGRRAARAARRDHGAAVAARSRAGAPGAGSPTTR